MMSEKLHRAQILLEPEQYRTLAELASQEGSSISGLVREAVGQYLTARDEDVQKLLREEALEGLRLIREKIEAEYGVYPGDPVAEVRAERERQREETWSDE